MGKGNRRRNNSNRDDNSSRGEASTSVASASSTTGTAAADEHKTSSAAAAAITATTRDVLEKYILFSSSSSDSQADQLPMRQQHTQRSTNTTPNPNRRSFYHWCLQERQGIIWVWGCILLGSLLGFGVGSGWLMGEYRKPPSTWRINMGGKIRSNPIYKNTIGIIVSSSSAIITTTSSSSSSSSSIRNRNRKISNILDNHDGDDDNGNNVAARNGKPFWFWQDERIKVLLDSATRSILNMIPFFPATTQDYSSSYADNNKASRHHGRTHTAGAPSVVVRKIKSSELRSNPSHPYVYAVLREAIVREKGGYVHPDLGIMESAPSGAARGIGMVRNLYHNCQTKCVPGIATEKLEVKRNVQKSSSRKKGDDNERQENQRRYMQEEVLIRVPLSYQMTRKVALDTLLPRITSETQRNTVHELDDAALLVLLLAHERGVGQYSRWLPYIASLPREPSCGYSQKLRPYLLDTINALRDEIGMEVDGWPGELIRATEYSERIVAHLSKDYGSFLQHPKGVSAQANIRWALCQVASRATGGSQKHGALRMIPLIDMLNHDAQAGGFVELTGTERLEKGDFLDGTITTNKEETDGGGTFVVRSLRHGRRKALRLGQELLVNYNIPHYSALDWLVSSGFVPPERYQNWQKLDAPLPRIRRDGPFAGIHDINNGNSNNAASGRVETHTPFVAYKVQRK